MFAKKGIVEIGSKNNFVLEELAKKFNSKSTFEGEIDNQTIASEENYDSNSNDVLSFLKKLNK